MIELSLDSDVMIASVLLKNARTHTSGKDKGFWFSRVSACLALSCASL